MAIAVLTLESIFAAETPVGDFVGQGSSLTDSLFSGREPASQWLAGPRPESAAFSGAPGTAADAIFAPPADSVRPPRLGSQVHRESWLRRPLSATWFLGGVVSSPIIDDWVRGEGGVFGGLRLGWDFHHYWGAEFRMSFGSVELIDSQRAIDAQHWYDRLAGYSPDDPHYHRFDGKRFADLFLYDINLLYYPRGDDPLRPYFSVGIGGTQVSLMDRLGRSYDATLLTMPVGIGLKYHWTDWLALRIELSDNIAFGSAGLSTLHNVSIVGAAEIRLGGSRRSYWPWTPGRASW